MQAATVTLKRETTGHRIEWSGLMTKLMKGLTRVFGCWHREMSRPFTLRAESYRVCLECGAHREFDTKTWEMTGPFYYEHAPARLYQNFSAAVKITHARRGQPRVLRAA
jgi:hypothetical protein